ncbi:MULTISPECIES: helix-turn-helix domain-containing protein [unclassified Streptomyces]|uniref:hypothetical protein n=1 Tax=Streptomyces sp. NPDC127129 TaxID=3345373 RepID=UPI003633A0E0
MSKACPSITRHLVERHATVRTHVARIFAELTLRDRAQAVFLAYETRLVTPGESASSAALDR